MIPTLVSVLQLSTLPIKDRCKLACLRHKLCAQYTVAVWRQGVSLGLWHHTAQAVIYGQSCCTLALSCFPSDIPLGSVRVTEWRFIGLLIVLVSDLPPASRELHTHTYTHTRARARARVQTAYIRLGIVTDGQMLGRAFEWLYSKHDNNIGCLQLQQAVIPPFMLFWARRWLRACWDQFCEASIVAVGVDTLSAGRTIMQNVTEFNYLKTNAHLSYISSRSPYRAVNTPSGSYHFICWAAFTSEWLAIDCRQFRPIGGVAAIFRVTVPIKTFPKWSRVPKGDVACGWSLGFAVPRPTPRCVVTLNRQTDRQRSRSVRLFSRRKSRWAFRTSSHCRNID